MCGIAGYSLSPRSGIDRTLAAQALLAGIADRGADAVGYAYRSPADTYPVVTKQRTPARHLLERERVVVRVGGECEDRLRVDGHPRLRPRAAERREQLVVVEDDPVVDSDDGPVPHRVVVGRDRGMAFCVVANVDEELVCVRGHLDPLEQAAGRHRDLT